MKEICKQCKYLTGKKGDKRYKCYTSRCPAKIRDDKEENNAISNHLRAKGIKGLEGQIAVPQSRLGRLRKGA